jgi:hypothetical protein
VWYLNDISTIEHNLLHIVLQEVWYLNDISTIEHNLLHIVLQGGKRTYGSIPTHAVSAPAGDTLAAGTKSSCHWRHTIWYGVWIHVAPCSERSQVRIVGRRNCTQHTTHERRSCVTLSPFT